MTNNTTKPDSLQPAAEKAVDLFDNWFDPIETEVRARAREFIEELLRGELRHFANMRLAVPRLKQYRRYGFRCPQLATIWLGTSAAALLSGT